jgi:hypothetical protein
VLLVALLVVVLLTGGLALAAASLGERQRAVLREADAIRLAALADACLAETLARLAARPGFAGLTARSFGGGTLESEVRRPAEDAFEILAWADYRGRRRAVYATGRFAHPNPVVLDWRVAPAVEARSSGAGRAAAGRRGGEPPLGVGYDRGRRPEPGP